MTAYLYVENNQDSRNSLVMGIMCCCHPCLFSPRKTSEFESWRVGVCDVATQEARVPPASYNYNTATEYMDQNPKRCLRDQSPRHEDIAKRAQRKQNGNYREADKKFHATTARPPFNDH